MGRQGEGKNWVGEERRGGKGRREKKTESVEDSEKKTGKVGCLAWWWALPLSDGRGSPSGRSSFWLRGSGGLNTVGLRSRFWVLGALSWRLCSGSRCPVGGPAPAPPSKGWGRKVKRECGRSPASYLRKAGRAHSRPLKSRARSPAVPPQSQRRLSDQCWALQQQLGGSDCRLLRGGDWGPASRAQGAAIWSLAAGGARVLETGPACRTRGQGQRPAGGSSPWWQRRLPCGLRANRGRGRACVRKARLKG